MSWISSSSSRPAAMAHWAMLEPWTSTLRSPAACLAALLGQSENGRWLIAPKDLPIETSRRYGSGTLVLEAEFRTEAGSATLVDFMTPGDSADLVRIVVDRQGSVEFRAEFAVRFNYGATVPWVIRLDDGGVCI